MKKLSLFITTIILSLTIGFTSNAEASASYIVKSGDTLWNISKSHGISLGELRQLNNKHDDVIYPGQTLKIPDTITAYEKRLLAQLVHAEAKGEPYAGKVAVATVVLNRVDSSEFPNSIHGVVYETYPSGSYAFTPVKSGSINKPANDEAYRAVEEALAFRGQGSGSIFFYNPDIITNTWILSRTVTITIGDHVFAR